MMDYFPAKFEPKILKNKGAFELSMLLNELITNRN